MTTLNQYHFSLNKGHEIKARVTDIKLATNQQRFLSSNHVTFDVKIKENSTIQAHIKLDKNMSKNTIDVLYGLADKNIIGFSIR